ncbi:MAG: hypothetical protein KAQ97_00800 [Candidatus Fermentibacteraceae bacterium]|nr:hypothetical protein [Candidatus Fermentibacteraceae bacterium]
MRKIILINLLLLFVAVSSSGELMRIVHEPTAGIVAPRTYYISMNTFPNDGLRFSFCVGIIHRLAAGLGYGGWNITGMSDPSWFEHIYLKARFRLLDETIPLPGMVLGFDNEPEAVRSGGMYRRKARDLYLALSKNFQIISGDMALHFGISADVRELVHAGVWTGLDKSFPAGFGLAIEYDFATDEADSVRFDVGGGFFSGEVYWESFGQVRISLQFIDMLETGGRSYRALGIDFLGLF